jgi:hypothetical protein
MKVNWLILRSMHAFMMVGGSSDIVITLRTWHALCYMVGYVMYLTVIPTTYAHRST